MEKKPYNPLESEPADFSFDLSPQIADEHISIIIVHKDQPAYLNICLQSITVASLNNNYEIIVVDNGSTSKDAIDFLDDLQSQGDCKVIRNKENLWWSPAANIGARAADKNSKYFIFMHSDVVILNPTWIDSLINVSEGQDSGMIGVEMHAYYMDKQKIDFIDEWCVLITRECFKDCGGFSEELPMVGASFLFTMAAQMADHRPQVIKNTMAHHYHIFGMEVSDFEKSAEGATVLLPRLMQGIQSKIKKKERNTTK